MKCRFPSGRCSAGPLHRESRLSASYSRRGVALVITLVLLAVITFMAIAFLVLSQGERGAVTTSTEQANARLAADAGLERAKAALLGPIRALGKSQSYGLLVSTNYHNPAGFVSGNDSLLNVSYNYLNGQPLNQNDYLQNLANLLSDPRPPVFVTNTSPRQGIGEFRYYLDLNRNGRYDTNGFLPVMNPLGGFYDTNGFPIPQRLEGLTLSNFFVGDPEWVGSLEFPDRRHSGTNRFLHRYAYIAIPAGQTLDINSIHNYAKIPDANMSPAAGDGFLRNQGVGPWEINLAGFLVDLNTNLWATNASPFVYNWRSVGNEYTLPNRGIAFDDALFLLRYRYYDPYLNSVGGLGSVFSLFGNRGVFAFNRDLLDGYSAGPVITSPWTYTDNDVVPVPRANRPWSGSENPARIFTTQDFFDRNRLAANATYPPNVETFSDRLLRAGQGRSSYDRYTFYRMLSQLGSDSEPEESGKINLNYDNINVFGNQQVPSVTNYNPWIPVAFFTNAANRMLADAGFKFNVSNIPLYPTNHYTPSVHRILQFAANLLDSTTNYPFNSPRQYPKVPHVFSPMFDRDGDLIRIAGYYEVLDDSLALSAQDPLDLNFPAARNNIQQFSRVYGVPVIVGAKKGLPNFNEFSMQTHVQVSRLLEFRRPNLSAEVNETNQMYIIGISNVFGMEAWNSYSNAYPRSLFLRAVVDMTSTMTNEFNVMLQSNTVRAVRGMRIAQGQWRGWTNLNDIAQSFVIPFQPPTNSFPFLSSATYRQGPVQLVPQTHIFERQAGFAVPRWWLNLNTRVQFYLVDEELNRIVDFVTINHTEQPIDLMAKLAEEANCNTISPDTYSNPGSQWCTNRAGGNTSINVPTYGLINQIGVGLNGASDMRSFSMDPAVGRDAESAVDGFRYNLKGWSPKYARNIGKTFYRSNIFYAPLVPNRPIYVHTTWQANDPLVHYTVGDLVDLQQTNKVNFTAQTPTAPNNLGVMNSRYQPWGGRPGGSSNPSVGDRDLRAKDPLITRSDDWEFPTNKFPNVGWIGRVHRGTPWQTVYLKPEPVGLGQWLRWTGNGQAILSSGQVDTNIVAFNTYTNDAYFSHPIHDRKVVDLFTTAISDTASRGRMSINQSGLAAWSAVLSGVNVLPDAYTNMVIPPAGVYDPLDPAPVARIVDAINNVRQAQFRGSFSRLGEIVAVPELTTRSPFLSGNTNAMNDAVYERIPQQILGLLHCDNRPRFVIYSFGQSLKPAANSVVTGGPFFGMVRNYQVTAESAIRAVVRVENPTDNPRVIVESFNPLPPD